MKAEELAKEYKYQQMRKALEIIELWATYPDEYMTTMPEIVLKAKQGLRKKE